jgi:hypothetical protein
MFSARLFNSDQTVLVRKNNNFLATIATDALKGDCDVGTSSSSRAIG